MKVTPGAVMVLPIAPQYRDAGEEDRHVLVLSVEDNGDVTVLVLGGRLLGHGPGQVKVLHGLSSLLQLL